MTSTYDPANLAHSSRDQIRWRIGDVGPDYGSDTFQLQDEEIDFELSQGTNVLRSAIGCVQALIGRTARQVDYAQADMKENLSQRVRQYQVLLGELQQQLGRGGVRLFAGGINWQDHSQREQDSNLMQPSFRRIMFEEPGVDIEDAQQYVLSPFGPFTEGNQP